MARERGTFLVRRSLAKSPLPAGSGDNTEIFQLWKKKRNRNTALPLVRRQVSDKVGCFGRGLHLSGAPAAAQAPHAAAYHLGMATTERRHRSHPTAHNKAHQVTNIHRKLTRTFVLMNSPLPAYYAKHSLNY